ncbi:hypothetical protein AGMMS49938_12160 [Fibrobacterales bacterium]|nr:hypothetical protein AGMMS49938_12160 [Fibrobacterales bacterium]
MTLDEAIQKAKSFENWSAKTETKEQETESTANVRNRYLAELEQAEEQNKFLWNLLVPTNRTLNDDEQKHKELLSRVLKDRYCYYKRAITFIETFKQFIEDCDKFYINGSLLEDVIQHYVSDLDILKKRYNSSCIKLPKIAGLMANSIVRFKPIVLKNSKENLSKKEKSINESFAIYHGLCICSDFSKGVELETFLKSTDFNSWFDDMLYLLRNRNYTSESLIVIFKTLCQNYFKLADVEIDP